MSKITDRTLELVAPVADRMHLVLVDAETARMGKRSLLRIYIDREGGLDIDACEAFHRAIVDILEEIDYDYLEVSSPGDRPLKRDADFIRMRGREVEVTLYAARDGKKRFEGVLAGRDGTGAVLLETPGGEVAFEADSVSCVKPLFRVE